MEIKPRHLLELLRLAVDDPDPFPAAALYPSVGEATRAGLAGRLFDRRRDRLALAEAPFLSPMVLTALAEAGADDRMLARRLARNPATPAAALSRLWRAGSDDPRLALLLARHQALPRGVLDELATRGGADVLEALCQNSGCAPEVLADLQQRGQPDFQRLLAVNLATTAATLSALWRQAGEAAVRAQVLLHPRCPARLLDSPQALPASALERRCLGARTRREKLLTRLASDEDAGVRRAVAANPALAEAAILALCFDDDVGVRRVVAARRELPSSVPGWLLRDRDAWVRRTIARNPVCPTALLDEPAKDRVAEVRRAVGRHPACPPALLVQLAGDADPWVQAGVAYRDDLPPALVRRLARSPHPDVLAGVGRSPAASVTCLARLAGHADADVRRAVILNRRAPRKVVLALRHDRYALHRAMLIDHPGFTDADRWRLRLDPDVQVRYRVFVRFARLAAVSDADPAAAAPAVMTVRTPRKTQMETA